MPTAPLPVALDKFFAYFFSCEVHCPTVYKPASGIHHLSIDIQTEIA